MNTDISLEEAFLQSLAELDKALQAGIEAEQRGLRLLGMLQSGKSGKGLPAFSQIRAARLFVVLASARLQKYSRLCRVLARAAVSGEAARSGLANVEKKHDKTIASLESLQNKLKKLEIQTEKKRKEASRKKAEKLNDS